MDLRAFIQNLYNRGDDPYQLAGKRDDTLEMILSLVNSGQETPEQLMGVEQPPPPPPVAEKSTADQMWGQFQDMNPNLDYDAVAKQSGGNVPGGAFSQMPESAKQKEQVQSLMDYVQNEIPKEEIARKLDPRSRAYDPQGAALLIEDIKQRQKGESEAVYAQARALESQLAQKAFEYQNSVGGRIDTMIEAIRGDKMIEMEAPEFKRMLLVAKQLQLSGDEAGATDMFNQAMMKLQPAVRQDPRPDSVTEKPQRNPVGGWNFSRATGMQQPGT